MVLITQFNMDFLISIALSINGGLSFIIGILNKIGQQRHIVFISGEF